MHMIFESWKIEKIIKILKLLEMPNQFKLGSLKRDLPTCLDTCNIRKDVLAYTESFGKGIDYTKSLKILCCPK